MVQTVTEENIKDIISSSAVVMIDFGATWCGPCQALKPTIEELSNDYAGRMVVGAADVDDCPDLSAEYKVRSVPTILFFKNGELVDKSVGNRRKEDLASMIDSLL